VRDLSASAASKTDLFRTDVDKYSTQWSVLSPTWPGDWDERGSATKMNVLRFMCTLKLCLKAFGSTSSPTR
jgi:hypothetical protein